MPYPLENLRVLDISRVLAGPFAGRMLADLGADVVKLEPPDNDVTRLWGADIGGNRGYYHQQNAGKRNISINLSNPDGALLVAELAAKADVVIENFRPGVATRLGVGYESLSKANPRLVMLSISGFGQQGPESQRAAFAPVIHAEAGLIDRLSRTNDGKLVDLPLSVSDTHASLHGMVGVLAALLMRERTGLGQHIDMAMIDATLATDDFLHYALEDSWQTRVLPAEVWDAPGGPIVLSVDFRHIWNLFRAEFGIADPAPARSSLQEKSDLRHEAIRDVLRTMPDRATLIALLDRLNIAWGDVRSSEDILNQPTVRHRGSVTRIDDRAGGTRPIVQSPYRFSAAESGVRGPAPWKGEHNDEVLKEWLGLDEAGRRRWAGVLVRDHRSRR